MRQLFVMMTLLCLHLMVQAQDFVPSRSVETVDDGVIVTYRFYGGIQQADPSHEGAKFWKIPGFSLNSIPAQPCLPYHWDTFAVPDGADVSVAVIDSAYSDTSFVLAPAYPPRRMSDTDSTYFVPDIAPYDGFLPRSLTQTGTIQVYRNQRLVDVCLLPIQYDHTHGTLRSYSSITYKLTFTESTRGTEQTRSASNAVRISPTDHFLDNCILNNETLEKRIQQKNQNTRTAGGSFLVEDGGYLILTTHAFDEATVMLERWKQLKGFQVYSVYLPSTSSEIEIKNAIQNYYNNYGIRYVVIIGDDQILPTCIESVTVTNYQLQTITWTIGSDFHYACLDSVNDITPDVMLGRIPVRNVNEAKNVIEKIIEYEQNPPSDASFYRTSAHAVCFLRSSSESGRAVQTSEDIINYYEVVDSMMYVERIYSKETPYLQPLYWNNDYYSDGSPMPSFLQYPNYAWDGNNQDIINAINNGCLYLWYNAHGNEECWYNPEFIFNDIDTLNNHGKYPIIFSLACLTGRILYEDDCIAESFLKKKHAGGVAVIAPSDTIYMGATEILGAYMIDAIWPEPGLRLTFRCDSDTTSQTTTPIYDIASILNQAKMRMYGFTLKNNPITNQIYEGLYRHIGLAFQCYGDPSLQIWTDIPTSIEPTITLDDNLITVSTNCGDATISFYSPSRGDGSVDVYYGDYAEFDFPHEDDEDVYICINKHNKIPYIAYYKDYYIQNDTITNSREIIGNVVKIGRSVTSEVPEGNVLIDGANVKIIAREVELHPGTTIINSDFQIAIPQ